MSWNKWNTANLDLIWRPIRFAWIRIIMKEWLIRELTCQVSLYTRVPWPDFQKVTFKTFTKSKIKIHTHTFYVKSIFLVLKSKKCPTLTWLEDHYFVLEEFQPFKFRASDLTISKWQGFLKGFSNANICTKNWFHVRSE